jgi:hypothetical protein
MPSAGFEPVNPVTKQPQTYALDRAATGIGPMILGALHFMYAKLNSQRKQNA